jgi:hypothetical protein
MLSTKDFLMKPSRLTLLGAGLALLLIYGLALPAAAQSYKSEKVTLAPPQQFSASVRDVLSQEAFRVTGPDGVVCELWLRQAVPATGPGGKQQEIAFPQISEGTLVGVIRFPSNVIDYRGQPIQSGVYTLRYALIPEDGAHMGVAPPQRDFLLLGPAADDAAPATLTRDQTLDLSRKVTHTRHPTVWSMAPSKTPLAAMPTMTHPDDPDVWFVNFPLTFEGGKTLPAALVIHGQAPYS